MSSLRDRLAIFTAKAAHCLLRALGSNASSAPGLIAGKISPNLLQSLLSEIGNAIYITGTNGKSTTSGLLAEVYRKAGNDSLIHNKSGANLISGILSTLIQQAENDPAILESDEAVLHKLTTIKPGHTLVNNFFRDQLDRFGELETTIGLVQQGLDYCPDHYLIANADDANVCKLKANQVLYYGISEECLSGLRLHQEELAQYESAKPLNNLECIELSLKIDGSRFKVRFPDEEVLDFRINIPGLFNIYNALGAITAANLAGIDRAIIQSAIAGYRPLFGRSELIQHRGSQIRIFLIKNPIGASEVLNLIKDDTKAKILIAINDNYADGRDISWLWDVPFEYLENYSGAILTSGTRGSDMAARLKYAGLNNIQYIPNLKDALQELSQNREHNLYFLPTYTALLSANKIFGSKF